MPPRPSDSAARSLYPPILEDRAAATRDKNCKKRKKQSKGIMKKTTNLLDELGGSCIIPKVHNYPRDTDYDGYNDYQSIQV